MDVSAVDLDLAYQLKGVKITRAERDRQRAILIGAQYHRTIEIEYFSDFFNLAVPPPWHDADLAGLDHPVDAARGALIGEPHGRRGPGADIFMTLAPVDGIENFINDVVSTFELPQLKTGRWESLREMYLDATKSAKFNQQTLEVDNWAISFTNHEYAKLGHCDKEPLSCAQAAQSAPL